VKSFELRVAVHDRLAFDPFAGDLAHLLKYPSDFLLRRRFVFQNGS